MSHPVILTGGPMKHLGKILSTIKSRSLIDLGGKTLLDHIIGAISSLVDEITVVYDEPSVASRLASCNICRSLKAESKGVEGTICSILGSIENDRVTIIYGDVYSETEFYLSHLRRASIEYDTTLLTVTKPSLYKPGFTRIQQDDEGNVISIGKGELVVAGMITVAKEALREMCKEKLSLDQLLQKLVARRNVRAVLWPGPWVDIDTAWDYLVAVQYELNKLKGLRIHEEANVAGTAQIEPPVLIDKDARVDAYAVIRGPAYVGPHSLVGAHSFIRQGVLVQQNAVIGAYSEVKRSIICRDARIGSHGYITDSVIGEKAELAPYTVTQNIPYHEIPREAEILLSTTLPLGRIKIGAIVARHAKTKPHTTLEPGQEYE